MLLVILQAPLTDHSHGNVCLRRGRELWAESCKVWRIFKGNARVWSGSGAAKVLSHFWVNCMVQQCALRYIPAALRLVCLCSLICPSKAKHLLLCSFSVHFDLLRAKSYLVHETCLYTMCREFHRSLTAVKSFLVKQGQELGSSNSVI